MLVLGVILAIVGYFLMVPILETIGIILIIVGAILFLLGGVGHPVAGRRYWW